MNSSSSIAQTEGMYTGSVTGSIHDGGDGCISTRRRGLPVDCRAWWVYCLVGVKSVLIVSRLLTVACCCSACCTIGACDDPPSPTARGEIVRMDAALPVEASVRVDASLQPEMRVDDANPPVIRDLQTRPPDRGAGDSSRPGWIVAYRESFESAALPSRGWRADSYPDDGPFSDNGVYFRRQGIVLPVAYRATAAFSEGGWLTLEHYSRSNRTSPSTLAQIVADPEGGANRVLRIASPAHTDATVVRPTAALPERYRISLRVGYPSFGSGGGDNGYDGDERAEPWRSGPATTDNGFYWLAILDATPRPHNNVWIHHHRKVVIDSDNHLNPFTSIWNGSAFVPSGVHPLMIFALDGLSPAHPLSGKPFIAYAAGQWHREADVGEIRAADAYKSATWYKVTIERNNGHYTFEVSGDFAFGGRQTYRASIDYRQHCVWHYNVQPGADSRCIDNRSIAELGAEYPQWPADRGWPDFFMFGDPHVNYYEGQVYYDDLVLEVWSG